MGKGAVFSIEEEFEEGISSTERARHLHVQWSCIEEKEFMFEESISNTELVSLPWCRLGSRRAATLFTIQSTSNRTNRERTLQIVA